jgi:CubicO group peptidase (beta-lactamase class C family)
MRRYFLLVLLGVLVTVGGISAGETDPSAGLDKAALGRIPERMKRFVEDGTISGAVTLVARHGKVAELDAVGMQDVETGRLMRPDSIFQIMSMTKPFTGVGIMMLAEEGKLALRDPVERFLPEFKGVHVMVTTGPDGGQRGMPLRPINVRDLMTHTSGVFDSPPSEIRDYFTKMNIPLAELVKIYARQPLLFQPGTHWSYSSPGIDILGRIIEVCSGQKYEDFITERILKPLEMKDSFFYPTPDKIERIAMVYESHDGKLKRSPETILGGDPSLYRKGAVYPAPAWGLYSTAPDLVKFYQMMLSGGTYQGRRYLSKASVGLMTEVHTGDLNPSGWLGGSGYGLTWEVVKDPYAELVGHTIGTYGHGGAFGTEGWIDPKRDLIRVMLIQSSGGGTNSVRDTFMTMAASAVE